MFAARIVSKLYTIYVLFDLCNIMCNDADMSAFVSYSNVVYFGISFVRMVDRSAVAR